MKTYSVTESPVKIFVEQNYEWCKVKANLTNFLYLHIHSTKIKRFVSRHAKIPDATELIIYHYLLPDILKDCCVLAYCT